MRANCIQQEILLVTGTTFLTRECCEINDGCDKNELTEKEKLKVACRKGRLAQMLPEIFELHSIHKKLSLWEMGGSVFIELKPAEIYLEVEIQYSIDPYSFLPMQILS